MKRSTFVTFAIVVAILGIGLPVLAILREGAEEASPEAVAPGLEEGKKLFATNCGSCHTLEKAGTDGVVGPNLDERLVPSGEGDPAAIEPRVATAIENGVAGRMPAGILSGPDAETVAEFVAQVAGN